MHCFLKSYLYLCTYIGFNEIFSNFWVIAVCNNYKANTISDIIELHCVALPLTDEWQNLD